MAGYRASVFDSILAIRPLNLGLTGWVANRYDGSVEVVAEGPRAVLDQLLDFLQQGPSMARVDQVQHEFLPATQQFKRFTIEG